MDEEYGKIARQIIELIEQVPTKRYGEINLVLAKELGLMLVDVDEERQLDEIQASGSTWAKGISNSRNPYVKKLEQIIVKLAKCCDRTQEEEELIMELVK